MQYFQTNNGIQQRLQPLNALLNERFDETNCFFEFVVSESNTIVTRSHFFFPGTLAKSDGIADPKIQVNVNIAFIVQIYLKITFFCLQQVQLSWNCFKTSDTNGYRMHYSLTVQIEQPALFVSIQVIHPDIVKYKLSTNGFVQTEPVQTVFLEYETTKTCVELEPEHLKIHTLNQYMPQNRNTSATVVITKSAEFSSP